MTLKNANANGIPSLMKLGMFSSNATVVGHSLGHVVSGGLPRLGTTHRSTHSRKRSCLWPFSTKLYQSHWPSWSCNHSAAQTTRSGHEAAQAAAGGNRTLCSPSLVT